MKRALHTAIVLICFCLIVDSLSAVNIPQRHKCDTILWRGRMNELNYMVKVIDAEMKRTGDPGLLATIEVLMAEFQEAVGNYLSAKRYYQLAVNHFQQAETNKGNSLQTLYDYAECRFRMASLSHAMGETSEQTLHCYDEAAKGMGQWINRAKDHLDEPLTKARLVCIQIKLPFILGAISLHGREFAEGLRSLQEAKEYIDVGFGKRSQQTMEYAEMLSGMADIHERTENYEQAVELYTEAASVIGRLIGPSLMQAQTLTRIASIYYTLNDLDKAIDYFNKANKMLISLNQTQHPLYADLCNLAGMIYLNTKQIDLSAQAFDVALAIYKKQTGEKSFLSTRTTVYTGFPLLYKGQLDAAWERAGACLHSSMNENVASDHFINSINFAIDIGLARRDYREIIDLAGDMRELVEEGFRNMVSPSTLYRYHINVGRSYTGLDDYSMAAAAYAKALALQRTMAHDVFSFLPEKQRELFWSRDESRFESIMALNRVIRDEGKGVGKVLYDAALLRKGLMLQASVNLASVVSSSGNRQLADDLQRLRLARMKAEEQGLPLPEEMRQLEQRILKQARTYGDFMQFTSTTWQDVQRALKPGDVAIEFVSSKQGSITVYSAELLTKQSKEPQHILLFTIEDNKPSPLAGGVTAMTEYVGSTVWPKQLLRYLTPGCNVYFTPTDQLYSLPIEYLPLAGGQRMNERYKMHRLSSTRLLAEWAQGREPLGSAKSNAPQAVLFGGLNFDSSMDDMELYALASSDRGVRPRQDLSRNFNYRNTRGMGLWGYLPGTLTEVRQIDQLLNSKRYASRLITGDEGVEESFKALHNRPIHLIHIATHGFYLPNEKDAMKRSGLVFAGANNFWAREKEPQSDEIDDGILTAAEIARMNLQRTSLVVMSACQSGLGEVTGEGVFGLQRAFKKAGVGSLLISLWEVDDQATQLMMTCFYQALIQGKTKQQALSVAQDAVKAQRFAYSDGSTRSGSDPYYWAAFVLMDAE